MFSLSVETTVETFRKEQNSQKLRKTITIDPLVTIANIPNDLNLRSKCWHFNLWKREIPHRSKWAQNKLKYLADDLIAIIHCFDSNDDWYLYRYCLLRQPPYFFSIFKPISNESSCDRIDIAPSELETISVNFKKPKIVKIVNHFDFCSFLFAIADVLSYLNVLACTINQQPWECVYQRSGRLFDIIDDALVEKVNELKGKIKSQNENI